MHIAQQGLDDGGLVTVPNGRPSGRKQAHRNIEAKNGPDRGEDRETRLAASPLDERQVRRIDPRGDGDDPQRQACIGTYPLEIQSDATPKLDCSPPGCGSSVTSVTRMQRHASSNRSPLHRRLPARPGAVPGPVTRPTVNVLSGEPDRGPFARREADPRSTPAASRRRGIAASADSSTVSQRVTVGGPRRRAPRRATRATRDARRARRARPTAPTPATNRPGIRRPGRGAPGSSRRNRDQADGLSELLQAAPARSPSVVVRPGASTAAWTCWRELA